jgi:murein DD-endopeptidase MepM/ murein hydrolase activator NlpD/peptidoglycan hydrolase-like protein with peptidoglycan-binding domain
VAEQMIRVSAKGEFGQLERGLKNLQSDLRNVTGEIDRGARKGGIFDESQIRALDLFNRRFKGTMDELNREFKRQNNVIDEMHGKMKGLIGTEKREMQDAIGLREKELDVIRKKLMEMEKIHQLRNKESQSYTNTPTQAPGGGGAGAATGGGLLGGVGSKLLGAGKFALGLAGVGGLIAMITEAYQQAYQREVGSLDLAQRLRGAGMGGSATSMYDRVSEVGRRDSMGYTQPESWQLQEAYTGLAGRLGLQGQEDIQRFSRGYGLDATQIGAMTGQVKQIAGTGTPGEFLDSIAGAVKSSGMTPRILEVLESHTGLLQTINRTFKDGVSTQILAYQTTLDQIGNEKGMTALTGQSGANVLGGLSGIFNPGNDQWKWMGIRALQNYNPEKYEGKGLLDLEQAFEDGINNEDNIPALGKYLKEIGGGNQDFEIRSLQKWLQAGGFNANVTQTKELYEATDGLQAFDPSDPRMKAVLDSIKSGDSGEKYETRKEVDEAGQNIMDIDAAYSKALESFGSKYILPPLTELKSGVTGGLEDIEKLLSDVMGEHGETLNNIYEFMKENWKLLATVAGVGIVANNVMKVVAAVGIANGMGGGKLIPWMARFGVPAALVAAGTYGLVKGTEAVDNFVSDGGFASEDLAKANFLSLQGMEYNEENLAKVPDWITHPAQLDMERSSRSSKQWREGDPVYYKEDERWQETEWGAKDAGFFGLSKEESKRKMLNDMGYKVGEDGKLTENTDLIPQSKRMSEKEIQALTDYLKNMAPSEDLQDAGDSEIGRRIGILSSEGRRSMESLATEGEKNFRGMKEKLTEILMPVASFFKFLTQGNTSYGMQSRSIGENSFFEGWQDRVTSRFGSSEAFRKGRAHGGLDINGEQGDPIDALMGGIVRKIKMDDGGALDKDGRMNSTGGGTEIVIEMPDGSSYFYSHLSKINPNLSVGSKVGAGDYIGNMGGDRGMPGSGSSTTGSHLHLGHMDKYGNLQNPEDLLNSMNSGGSEMGHSRASEGSSQVIEHKFSMDLHIHGDGAKEMSNLSLEVMRQEARRMFEQLMRERLAVNPTVPGWNQ